MTEPERLIAALDVTEPEKLIAALDAAFVRACSQGDVAHVKEVLSKPCGNLNLTHDYESWVWKGIRAAAAAGHNDIVRLILRPEAEKDSKTWFGKTQTERALWWAASRGEVNIVKVLLDGGADIHFENDGPLRIAVNGINQGMLETVKLLLDRGANLHAAEDEALTAASIGNKTRLFKLLISRCSTRWLEKKANGSRWARDCQTELARRHRVETKSIRETAAELEP